MAVVVIVAMVFVMGIMGHNNYNFKTRIYNNNKINSLIIVIVQILAMVAILIKIILILMIII